MRVSAGMPDSDVDTPGLGLVREPVSDAIEFFVTLEAALALVLHEPVVSYLRTCQSSSIVIVSWKKLLFSKWCTLTWKTRDDESIETRRVS